MKAPTEIGVEMEDSEILEGVEERLDIVIENFKMMLDFDDTGLMCADYARNSLLKIWEYTLECRKQQKELEK
tara:strand:- start:598 stop:813 length:216 start_codon:yes stop_codon:yes gene_type:complete